MKDDRDVALGCLRKAESDLANAELCVAAGKSLDTACFHCQQAAEKALKAYLIANKIKFPLIHDLKRLLDDCSRLNPAFCCTWDGRVAFDAVRRRDPLRRCVLAGT
jgi:HEPN domain-containing protein